MIARGADAFFKSHGHAPGSQDGDYTADTQPLKEVCTSRVLSTCPWRIHTRMQATLQAAKDLGVEDAVTSWDNRENCSLDDLVAEYCRCFPKPLSTLSHLHLKVWRIRTSCSFCHHGRCCITRGSGYVSHLPTHPLIAVQNLDLQVLKVTTEQFVPLQSCIIFNGIDSSSCKFSA